ncbi:MAG: PKD domain-containing protein, partial [Candidatus Sulfobium sp.]
MKITKTTLLFIATLFFLALPLAFVGSNAQAALPYTYNWTGAEHNADGGWTMPADNGTCIGADASTPVDGNAQTLGKQGPRENCGSVQPAWVGTDFVTQAACTAAGYAWKGKCSLPGYYHYAAECTADGGTWTPNPDGAGNCENMWYNDTSAAYVTGADTNHECLYCHNGGHGYNMSGYLKSAHANATRPADTYAWITPIEEGSTAYTSNSSGNAIDWANETIDISGTPTPFYWIFGSWLEGAPASARIIYQGFSQYGSSWVDCNRCHATGYDVDTTAQAGLEPYATFPSLATGATPADAPLNMTGNADESTTGWADWQHWGITCSRCHNAVDGNHADSGPAVNNLPAPSSAGQAGSVTPDEAVQQTFVCYQCHYQNDSKNLRDPRVTNPGEQLVDGGSAVVERHANGFLNSPHARFSGTYGQLADSTQYDSHFTAHYGSCAACHNVHDSVTDNAADAQTWNAECGLNCHSQDPSDPYAKPLANIQHPTGPGTPLYGVTTADPVEACQTCHMPGGLHLFRINPDPSYSTSTGGTYLNAIPDPTHNNFPSVYVDLDLACGQCHGGDTANAQATAAAHGAPYMTKAELAPYAEVMHGGTGSSAPTGKLFMWTNDSSNPYAVNFTVTGAACTEGGCSYSWDFGDGSTGSGPAVNHTYADGTPVNVTVTVSNGGTNTQIVTPIDVHTAPTCAGNAAFSTAVNAGVSGMAVSFIDGTTPTTDGTPGVYVNWGDGSP